MRSSGSVRILAVVMFVSIGWTFIPDGASGCHTEDHRFHVRGEVKYLDGEPAPGVSIWANDTVPPIAAPEGQCTGTALTGPSGRYEAVIHMHGKTNPSDHGDPVQVLILYHGRICGEKRVVADLKPNEPSEVERFIEGVDFGIEPGSVEGVVNSTLDGRPLDNALVTIRSAGSEVARATTAGDGSYRLNGLKSGSYALNFSRSGYLPHEKVTNVTPCGGAETVDASLGILPKGAPVPARGIPGFDFLLVLLAITLAMSVWVSQSRGRIVRSSRL